MSAEMLTAVIALLGLVGGAAAALVRFGTMTQRLDQLEKDRDRVEAQVVTLESQVMARVDKLIEGIDSKLDRIWEYLHQLTQRRSSNSRPPLGPLDQDEG